MRYIASDQIAVFPCGRRNDAIDPAARLTTEFNLVSIINRLVDQKSFVVPPKSNEIDDNTAIEFNIGGYLFKTTVSALKDAADPNGDTIINNGYIMGQIKLNTWDNSGDSYAKNTYQDLGIADDNASDVTFNLDDDSTFKGLSITYITDSQLQEGVSIDGEKQLLILKIIVDGGAVSYQIPEQSLIKFKTDTISRSVFIDDGDLD